MMRVARRLLAGICAIAALPAIAADPLPRVFFSPPQRAAITATRNATPGSSDSIAITVASPATPGAAGVDVVPRTPRLEGIVLARSGERFAWIGGKRYAEGERLGQWRLRISAHGVALLGNGGLVRQLRVGEAVRPEATVASAAP
jgi:hypothetical protein